MRESLPKRGTYRHRPPSEPVAPERKPRLDLLAVLLLVSCCLVWGLGQVGAKVAMVQVPALWLAALRSVGGAVLVALWARHRGVRLWASDGTLGGGLVAGTLFGAEFFCVFIGLQYTTASRMAVFIYLAPFVVAIGMPFVSRAERLAPRQVGGLVLAFAGVAWAFAEGYTAPAAGPRQWLGDALGVAAAVLWGGTTLAIRGSRLSGAAPEKTLLYQLAVSGVLLTGSAVAAGAPLPGAVSALVAVAVLFQVVIVSGISFVVWFWLMRSYPATQLASFTLLTPVFGLLMGALLLHEPVTARLVTALIGVAAGILLVSLPSRRRAA